MCGMMLSKYLYLPIVLVISPSKSSHMVSSIASAITEGMSDARMQSYSVNIVEVGVSCSAYCVRYTRFDVVLYNSCELICSKGIHVRG